MCVTQWPSGQRINERTIAPENPTVIDPNPRGNSRGGRGVVVYDDVVLVANYHTIEVCDHQLCKLGTVTDGNFAGLHEITRRGERLFVACTALNAVAELSLSVKPSVLELTRVATPLVAMRYWWPTENESVCQQLEIPPTYYTGKHSDNRLQYLDLHNRGNAGHLHLNAVDCDDNHAYALLNKPGAILDLDEMRIVLRDPLLEGAHNLEFVAPGRAYVVSTRAGLLVECDLSRGEVRPLINLNETPFAKQLTRGSRRSRLSPFQRRSADQSAQPLFWRGLAINEDWIFIGTSPAAILGFDRRTFTYCGVAPMSQNVREIIHGIAILGN